MREQRHNAHCMLCGFLGVPSLARLGSVSLAYLLRGTVTVCSDNQLKLQGNDATTGSEKNWTDPWDITLQRETLIIFEILLSYYVFKEGHIS